MQSARLLPFDPIVLVQDVLKRWLVVVLAALAVGIGTYIYTDATYAPVYRTTTTFVVTTRGSSTSVYSNLSSTSNLAGLFTELLNSSIMRKTIMQETDISSFDGTIDTAVVPNTNLITMTVTDSDPRMAFLAAQAIIEHHESLTYQVIDDIGLEVLQYPAVPTSPTNQNFAFHQMKKAAVIAALAATALLAILSYLRDAVRSGTEAREKLDCSYLGEISHERKYKTVFALLRRKKTSILITNPVTSFRFVESIRKLRRRVEQHMDGGKVLIVTSLLENEGKSTVAVNLALAMEQKGKRVLLIDCDLRKPACGMVLGQSKFAYGLNDILGGKENLSECFLRYQNSDMYMLLARRGEQNTGDLLISPRMNALLDWARECFDFIVLDLPPMSAASDAEGMADLADASLLVVRQNAAAAPALNNAVASLDGHKAKVLGCVLNNVYATQLSTGQSYGGYRASRPVYAASASFTVRVANPLYASVSSYNEKTAQVMADTFPSILTSGLLQRRVMDELGIDEVPDMSVSATAHSSILTLKVRDTDPQRAYDVMSAVIACYPEVAEFVVGSTVLVLLDESGMPTAPVAEFNYRYYITCGAVVGAAVWCVILAFLVLMKNTVHN